VDVDRLDVLVVVDESGFLRSAAGQVLRAVCVRREHLVDASARRPRGDGRAGKTRAGLVRRVPRPAGSDTGVLPNLGRRFARLGKGRLPCAAMLIASLACAAAALWALWWRATAAITIAVLDVEDGAIRRIRGGLSPGVLADLEEVVAKPPISRGRVRIVRDAGAARVEIGGQIAPDQAQRLRNVIGNVPLVRLARGRPRR
jgi:hypothetical protein